MKILAALQYKGVIDQIVCVSVKYKLSKGDTFTEYVQGKLIEYKETEQVFIIEQYFPLINFINEKEFETTVREFPLHSLEFIDPIILLPK